MSTRTTPTERQKRLGAELRKMRLAAGATTEYAAGLLGIDRTRLSNMESGIRPFSPERIRTLACNYACTDETYVDALVAIAAGKVRGWWEHHRGTLPSGLLDIAELEWHAARVRTAQVMHAPGLLQTEEYARAVFAAVLPPLSRLEVELRVAHRMERQQVFERSEPLPYIAYVHEAALRMPYGGREATREQLKHLAVQSERENIEVRVISTLKGGFPGAGHALLYADGAVPQLDTVQLDSAHGPEFTHAEAQLTKYRAHLDWMDDAAMSSEASRDVIHKIAREL
ncbi:MULTISPECIES: helix-turn-helix transcriptional regulator [unclassified Streptomyces]|uniref:helix-turn-helix domain-containing protein n=1 Tax=unclassified Streptomyces TaxID=2593676 RepID=UPI002367021D|nr:MULTISPECIES: helix-turn-helix transcriptional regulator [unclassified Streptomyces]MDF3141219.1 helix-turn-helix transcriptional regulator [Streptomyces sp. T21Q-yed]WDF40907.1 helix-turn-helix transcriptional regulator [Streptomyces sp. T12]